MATASCNNILSLTPAFSPPSPPRAQQILPSASAIAIAASSLHQTKAPRALRRGSKKSLHQQRPSRQLTTHQASQQGFHPDVPQIFQLGSQTHVQAHEEHHNNRPRKLQRNISSTRRKRSKNE